ncbi:universal stress protein [Flagellimonas sp. HMM57]|uniref:universal stress protein n=1 Tax=unclassified Flagellimonas TaxID=2644544 RepID=UPI0013D76247|nr:MULTISPECIES: universal stress protein [unclassified Flagellimonas]UII77048.1 universal stress protein [Flagellimonas sp. HMM57]
MNLITKFLIPFDFSEASINAMKYAMSLAGPNRDVDILALYVASMPITESEEETLKIDFSNVLKSFQRKVKNTPSFITAKGEIIKKILETQEEHEANLIVMGTMGDKSTDEAITNTSRLALEANCPVISVPFGCDIKEPNDIALVLGNEKIDDKEVLRTLLDISRTFDSRVHVLTIYKESVYAEESIVDSNENLLKYYLEHFYEEHAFSKNQDVEEGILDYITKKNIDLLAILPRNHTKNSTPSEGRLTKLLTLHSEIPVLTLD